MTGMNSPDFNKVGTMWVKQIQEHEVWHLIDNMKYFDISNLVESYFPGYMAIIVGKISYSDEGDVIHNLRKVGEVLDNAMGNEDVARVSSFPPNYLDGMMDMMESMMNKTTPKYRFNAVNEFDFWLKIYKYRLVDRSNMKLSAPGHYFNRLIYHTYDSYTGCWLHIKPSYEIHRTLFPSDFIPAEPKMAIMVPGLGFTSFELNPAIEFHNQNFPKGNFEMILPDAGPLTDYKGKRFRAEGMRVTTEMTAEGYQVIAPLGARSGIATFDTFFDTEKYKHQDDAINAGDVVAVNFVLKDGTKYFQVYHTKQPAIFLYERLEIQNFPFGIDMRDDAAACRLAQELLEKNK